MTQETMFDVPASAPKWRKLMQRHGITARRLDETPERWGAGYELNDATILGFYGETERDAVVAMIHNLKLEGWETVSSR